MILGLHCDMRSGYLAALRQAQEHRCEAMQMFCYRRHQEPQEPELAAFREARTRAGVRRLVLHVRFLPGLGSEDGPRRARSVELLAWELRLARGLGGDFLILHLGAFSPGSSPEKGAELAADSVRAAWEQGGPGPKLLVENVPGGGRRLGGSLEELGRFLELLAARAVPAGACLDTAHAWAQGYDLSSREAAWRFLGRAHKLLGAEAIPVFHLNDTRSLLGSHREHHEHWGRGYLGGEGLAALLERGEYASALGILETPPGRDGANLAWVRSRAG